MDIANKVVEILKSRALTISTMESCTAGLIASLITDTEGASEIFPGGFVTYSNEAKIRAGVDANIIEEFGVYSEECAEAMAVAAREKFGTDFGVGITGTTGNIDPNNPDGALGEAYYCIANKTETRAFHIKADTKNLSRHEIKSLYAEKVFAALLEVIAEYHQS